MKELTEVISKLYLGKGRWEIIKQHTAASGKSATTNNIYVQHEGRFVSESHYRELKERGLVSATQELITAISNN